MQIFRADKQLTPSWQLMNATILAIKHNIWTAFYLSFVPAILLLMGLVLTGYGTPGWPLIDISRERAVIGTVVTLAASVLSLLAYPGFILAQLSTAITRKHLAPAAAFRAGLPYTLRLLVLVLIMTVLISAGLVAFIIPGLILVRGLLLAPYFLIDQNISPIEAIKRSFAASRPHAAYIWGTIGVTIVVSFAGSILGVLPVVGYLLSTAIGYIYVFAPALRYAEIEKHVTPKLSE